MPISDGLSTVLVLAIVLVGIGLAYWRYGTAAATAGAPAGSRVKQRASRRFSSRGYYVDDLIGALVVRPAQAAGGFFGRILDPHVVDGAVRDLAWIAGCLGLFVRRLQNGLVRAYAIALVVGVAGFLAYYAFAGVTK